MNFVKLFNWTDYRSALGVVDAINAFAKENGCEPISIAMLNGSAVVVFQPIDYSNQTGSKE